MSIMSKSREFYRVTLPNNQVVELQKDDIDVLQKALQDEENSAEVTLPGEGNHKMTIYLEIYSYLRKISKRTVSALAENAP
jgi:hypothetical protein